MTLGRLVKQGELEHRSGRSGKYRIKRDRTAPGPRQRKIRPFPVSRDGGERKTISRSELLQRGWSKDLIDFLLPEKNRDFVIERLPKPGTRQTFIWARYYWVNRVRDCEAQHWFEEKRFELRRRPKQAASSLPSAARAENPDWTLPPRRAIQKYSTAMESPLTENSGSIDKCA